MDREVTVNGGARALDCAPDTSLLSFLREGLDLRGAKPGCGEGACGACTVLLDGKPVRSCVVAAEAALGSSITTIEGLAAHGRLHPVQQAFLDESAFQCGYCTPGMILSAVSLLEGSDAPSPAEIGAGLDGNVCRCGAHSAIVRAVLRAARGEPVELMPVPEPGSVEPLPAPPRPWSSLPPDERDFFAVLPEGLVVVATSEAAARGWSTCDEAWLHLGSDVTVTGFSGKVDVGQGNRGAMAALIAEQLGLPADAVRLVLGDTDLCPYDLGTFGSRSMPDAAPLLAQAAAAARRVLVGLAAERFSVARDALRLGAGALRCDDGRCASFAELLEGSRRVVMAAGEAITPPPDWSVAGRSIPHPLGAALVTGAVRFPSDLTAPGALVGRVLKPPAIGTRAGKIDASAAAQLGGARLVAEDGFFGAVAADAATAVEALSLVSVEWISEPRPSEPETEAYLRSHPTAGLRWDGPLDDEAGDVERGLAEASVRLESSYTTAYIAHAPLETRAALAEWAGDRLTVRTGTQRPFGVREELASELGIDEERIRVIAPIAGGGFGGKHSGEAAVEAARLARASGRPVRVHWHRGEEFQHAYARPAAVIDVRSGARDDGTLVAWDFSNLNSGQAAISPPYRCPNVRVRYQPADSPLRQGSYRALAATANTFARESHLDELAGLVGADPVELRLRHLEDSRLEAVLSLAADRSGWGGPTVADGVGMGIACAVEKDGRVASCAEVRVGADGAPAVSRVVTAFDCGAIVDPGSLRNQVEGAIVMGLGGALFEALHHDGGVISNATFAGYRVPRFRDLPSIEVLLVDRRNVPPAGGGETPIIAVAPAIANAIHAATGKRLRSLPLLPG